MVRLIGGLLVVWSILEIGLYWAECSNPKHPVPLQAIPILLKLIPALIGFATLIKARAIAEWISNTLDL